MKFLFALFATSVATAAAQAPLQAAASATDLASRWNMADEPKIDYDSGSNTFTIDYLGASDLPPQLQEEFYDVNCKDDGSGFPQNVMRKYFTDPDNSDEAPKMKINLAKKRPELKFKIDTEEMAKDPLIYEVVGAATNSCLGQYYSLTANITVQVDSDNFDQTQIPFKFKITDRKTGKEVTIPDNKYNMKGDTQYITLTQKIENLCRDTDYDFEFFSGDNEATTNLPTVELTYDSSGTPDVLFTKTVDEMNYKTNEKIEGLGNRMFSELFNLPLNPQNPATNLEGRDGKGMMKFCVRGGIGYADTSADGYNVVTLNDHSSTLAEVIAAGYVEVNFIESLITIFYDLTAGFKVDAFNVDPKERVETTEAKEAYELEAWLCEAGSTMETRFEGLSAPKAISANFVAGKTNTPEYFNQGALITVCVAPKQAAFADGIRMNGITSFDWKRDDFGTAFTNNLNSLPTDPVTQEAIEAGAASGNLLTSYIVNDCVGGKDYCRFSSILFADFYITTGVVSGTGDAKLTFAGSRRLGESSSRQLQADEGGASPFDLQVPVDITDTGPAGLKTAAGVSFAASTFTMAVALIGAALLA